VKTQDLIFGVIFLLVVLARRQRLAMVVGLLFLGLSIPLFRFWIFFTAERLTWYAAAFFAYSVVTQLFKDVSRRKNI